MESSQLEIGAREKWSENLGSILGEGKISSLLRGYIDLIRITCCLLFNGFWNFFPKRRKGGGVGGKVLGA